MNESEKMLEQALGKIAEMDKNLKEKLIRDEKERDWQEEIEHLKNEADRQSFIHLADDPFFHTRALFNATFPKELEK